MEREMVKPVTPGSQPHFSLKAAEATAIRDGGKEGNGDGLAYFQGKGGQEEKGPGGGSGHKVPSQDDGEALAQGTGGELQLQHQADGEHGDAGIGRGGGA